MNLRRRSFLKSLMGVGAGLSLAPSQVLGANADIRVGAIGLGSFVKIGGRGRRDVRDFQQIPGVRVVAVCDCDTDNLGYVVDDCKKRNETVKAYRDFRTLLDDPEVDAVTIAAPNHWHSLMAIMACQAGKDVFVQKPGSHNLFEGRKMVEAMRKYDRIVQSTHGPRGSGAVAESFEYVRHGHLGEMHCVYGINYRPRLSIGQVSGPQPIPSACDYNLWCGPSPKKPLMRTNLHYDWHWDWDTGNGDLGNMGIHYMDACRWALQQNALPRRVVTSIGGRMGYEDDGQTPNTLVTMFDYDPVPIIFEVRGLPKNASYLKTNWQKKSSQTMDYYRGVRIGCIVVCEGGYVQGDAAYDHDGRLIEKFTQTRVSTKQNFIDCVRGRKREELYSDALQGHLSAGLVHLANISYRLGRKSSTETIRDVVRGNKNLRDSFDRLVQHVQANHLTADPKLLTLGPALSLDPETERFVGPFSDLADRLATRKPRKPFVVPDVV